MQKIEVMNRRDAEEYCRHNHNIQSVMISIHNIGGKLPNVFESPQNKILEILRLEFNDIDKSDNMVGEITEDDAEQIKNFINTHKSIDRIIVHCEAGQSRSAGIAAAIMKFKFNDDTSIFNNKKYTPNMLCYRTVLNKLMLE